jgi:hypothetical protein
VRVEKSSVKEAVRERVSCNKAAVNRRVYLTFEVISENVIALVLKSVARKRIVE